ncbi:MAG: cation transporting ATPase C-terminal domain-containing protein [Saprospiraceae bacterium]|nr:cation transporting ATPase C-terminal domain-containing protein [Saprospiraceae bacterium]
MIPLVILISVIIFLLAIYYPPVRYVFEFDPLSALDWFICMGLAFQVFWIEIYKYF